MCATVLRTGELVSDSGSPKGDEAKKVDTAAHTVLLRCFPQKYHCHCRVSLCLPPWVLRQSLKHILRALDFFTASCLVIKIDRNLDLNSMIFS